MPDPSHWPEDYWAEYYWNDYYWSDGFTTNWDTDYWNLEYWNAGFWAEGYWPLVVVPAPRRTVSRDPQLQTVATAYLDMQRGEIIGRPQFAPGTLDRRVHRKGQCRR